MRLRLRGAWIIILLAAVALAFHPSGADATEVVVGVYENAPKIFTDESGKPAGIFIDIIEDIAKEEGWHLEYRSGTWGEGLDRLEKGEIDIMPDVAHSAERESIFGFHKTPVLTSWFQVYARRGSGIRSLLDLNGKRIVVLERSVQEEAFSRLAESFELKTTLIPLPDYKALFEKVARGEADAAITNRFYGLMHAAQYDLEDASIVFHPSNLYFATTSGDPKGLLAAIDRRLESLKENPKSVYYRSLDRWTDEKVAFSLPVWIKIVGLVVGTALVVSLAASYVLKRQVDSRTGELRQINREMESRIEQRTAELAAATEKAQAADHLKSAFLATMSHELRTPLNSVIGFTGILLQGLAGPLNQEQEKQLSMVQNSARHLLNLINDVLDISKIEAGQLSLSYSRFELAGSVTKMVEMVSPLAAKKGLELRTDIAGDVSEVTADQRRLEQVILNLLNNAVKFTEQGHVRISCRADNGQYLLSVADTGIGIRPEDIPGLFRPFQQVDTGLTRKYEGTGLGLSISKKLIVMMGGTIDVRSEWEKGSTFTIRIPRHSGVSS